MNLKTILRKVKNFSIHFLKTLIKNWLMAPKIHLISTLKLLLSMKMILPSPSFLTKFNLSKWWYLTWTFRRKLLTLMKKLKDNINQFHNLSLFTMPRIPPKKISVAWRWIRIGIILLRDISLRVDFKITLCNQNTILMKAQTNSLASQSRNKASKRLICPTKLSMMVRITEFTFQLKLINLSIRTSNPLT